MAAANAPDADTTVYRDAWFVAKLDTRIHERAVRYVGVIARILLHGTLRPAVAGIMLLDLDDHIDARRRRHGHSRHELATQQ